MSPITTSNPSPSNTLPSDTRTSGDCPSCQNARIPNDNNPDLQSNRDNDLLPHPIYPPLLPPHVKASAPPVMNHPIPNLLPNHHDHPNTTRNHRHPHLGYHLHLHNPLLHQTYQPSPPPHAEASKPPKNHQTRNLPLNHHDPPSTTRNHRHPCLGRHLYPHNPLLQCQEKPLPPNRSFRH